MARSVDLRRAAVKAAQAASIDNSQPWHFDLHEDHIDVFVERARQMPVHDPVGRQMTASVGCAVFNARVALAAAGCGARVVLTPDPSRSDLVARIEACGDEPADAIAHLDPVIDKRVRVGEDFVTRALPAHLRPMLDASVHAEGARTVWVETLEQLTLLAHVAEQAGKIQATELGELNETHPAHARTDYWAPFHRATVGCVLILCAQDDTVTSWLRAGQALQRMLLELTAAGYLCLPEGSPMEVPLQRSAIRRLFDLSDEPLLALIIGTGDGRPALRRRLVEVLTEH